MIDKLIETTEKAITNILNEGIQTNNLEHLYKLVDIHKDAKEEESMNYGNYGRYGNYNAGGNYGNYNEYNEYGRRGVDSRYKGHEYINRMYQEYGRYEEERERYGANEDTKRSLKYMLESMEDFARMLKNEAKSQEEVEMIRQTAQRIAQM